MYTLYLNLICQPVLPGCVLGSMADILIYLCLVRKGLLKATFLKPLSSWVNLPPDFAFSPQVFEAFALIYKERFCGGGGRRFKPMPEDGLRMYLFLILEGVGWHPSVVRRDVNAFALCESAWQQRLNFHLVPCCIILRRLLNCLLNFSLR